MGVGLVFPGILGSHGGGRCWFWIYHLTAPHRSITSFLRRSWKSITPIPSVKHQRTQVVNTILDLESSKQSDLSISYRKEALKTTMASAEPLKTNDLETGNSSSLEALGVRLPPEPVLKGPLKPVQETTPKEKAAAAVAAFAIITALVAIVLEGSAVVIVAGILSIIMGPYAYFQQTRLTDIATLKETAAVIQVEVEKLEQANNELSKNVDELSNTINDLQDVEEALDVISKTQGQSVKALEKQVAENKELLNKMKKSTKGRVIQNLISIIYRGDENADEMISDSEATKLVNELKKIGGVTVHEDRLRRAITGKPIDAVIEVVKNLMSENVPDDQKIFEVADE